MGMTPAAPGSFIRDQILRPLDLSISKAAEIIKVRCATLSDVVNDKARLSPEVALRLEKAFGVSMDLLPRIQTTYEAAQVRKKANAIGRRALKDTSRVVRTDRDTTEATDASSLDDFVATLDDVSCRVSGVDDEAGSGDEAIPVDRGVFGDDENEVVCADALRRLSLGDGAMNEAGHFRLRRPPHPGAFVKTEIVEALELSVTEAAQVLGITRTALSTFLNERSSLSPEMALRLEKAFGVSMETLMRMQNSYDIAEARKREAEIKVPRYHGKFPETPAGSH